MQDLVVDAVAHYFRYQIYLQISKRYPCLQTSIRDSQMHSTSNAHAYEKPNPNLYNHAVLKYCSSDICTDKSASQRPYQSAHARQCRH